jgi:NAD(P)-dependent dehydrogenase (short-subunit alcohol dehydrogenase family)
MSTNFFENKVYAVTGVAGIGLAVAKLLRQRGAKVSLADIDPQALSDAAEQLGNDDANVLTTKVDVTSASQVDAWIASTVDKFGRLDGAANMAGAIGKHHGIRSLIEQDDDEWDLIMRVNVTGLKNCLRAELKALKANESLPAAGSGSIVNASSIQGLQGFALHAAYSASKHAVTGLTRSVAKEVAPGIRVNAVAP